MLDIALGDEGAESPSGVVSAARRGPDSEERLQWHQRRRRPRPPRRRRRCREGGEEQPLRAGARRERRPARQHRRGLRSGPHRRRPPRLVKKPVKAIFDDKKLQNDLKKAAENIRDAANALRDAPTGGTKSGGGLGRKLLLVIVAGGLALALSRGPAQEGARRAVRRRGGVRVHLDQLALDGVLQRPRLARRRRRPPPPPSYSAMKSRTVTSAPGRSVASAPSCCSQAPGGTSSRSCQAVTIG